jgi:endonuclease/exonuclease/phosphatase family metal-dependent hydrolase
MKLISLNIEGRKHWDVVDPFFEAEPADVICLQEIFESDAKSFADRFSMAYVFAHMLVKVRDASARDPAYEKSGIALFSRGPLKNVRLEVYHAANEGLKPFDKTTIELLRETERNVMVLADVEQDGSVFTIGTTHFTWTPNGAMTEYQHEDAAALLKILADIPEIILCGDFNVPRGFNKIYDLFAANYEDAIPRSYVSSLDPLLHVAYQNPDAAKNVSQFMVDYLFLSKKYEAHDVRLHFGVSDHSAVVATVIPRIMNS